MISDFINDEILRIKRELAAKFDNDLGRIVADAQSREQNAITLPPRRWKPAQNEVFKSSIVGISDVAPAE